MKKKISNRYSEKKKISEADPYLIEKIQPEGGISFKNERYVMTGTGYECCIHIFDYPEDLSTHWLGNILNNNNTIVTIDIGTDNIIEVKKNINKSIKEQKFRMNNANSYEDYSDADRRLEELKRLWDELNSMGEVIKLLQARIFIYAKTLQELEERCKALLISLEANGYKAAVFLNETKNEWMSMYQPYEVQKKQEAAIYGQPITSESLAGGYPFHFSSLEDEMGTLLGYTATGGVVLFDWFFKSKSRLSYNGSVSGDMGAGKSSLLKKIMKDRAMRGDFIRVFDVAGDFIEYTKELGGSLIALDGSSGIINVLQILKASSEEESNYTLHISKLNTWYKFLMPEADAYDLIELEEQCRDTYIKFGILNKDGEIGDKDITGLPATKYPMLSDLVETIKENIAELSKEEDNRLQNSLTVNKLIRLDRLRLTLENLINNYGRIFNGHTSIPNVQDEQIITFDLTVLKGMKASVFDAQIFNAISLSWDNAISNGKIMKEDWENGRIDWEEIKRFLMIIDESHLWLNAKKIYAVDQISTYCREGRKYFAGIIFASQNVRDYAPDDSSVENINALKTLFELTQYKFIFRQPASAKPLLKILFNGQFTDEEIEKIPQLGQGETILSLGAGNHLEFKVYLTNEEIRMFRGGA